MNTLHAHGVPRRVWDALPLTPHYSGVSAWKELELDGLVLVFFVERTPSVLDAPSDASVKSAVTEAVPPRPGTIQT